MATMQQVDQVDILSHSSLKNNDRIVFLCVMIDQASLTARRSMRYSDIKTYWDAVEQLYINVEPVINQDIVERIKELKNNFDLLKYKIDNDAFFQTLKNLEILLSLTKDFNRLVIRGLQDLRFFFRTEKRGNKGLGSIDFFNIGSIFGQKKEQEEEPEQENEKITKKERLKYSEPQEEKPEPFYNLKEEEDLKNEIV